MAKFLQVFMSVIGFPLLEKLGKFLYSKFQDYLEEREIKKEINKEVKKLKKSKSKDEIINSVRNLKF